MHIVLDGVNIPPRMTGGGETYFRELIRALQAIDSPHHYTILAQRRAQAYLEPLLQPETRVRYALHRRLEQIKRQFFRPLTVIPSIETWLTDRASLIHWVNGLMYPGRASSNVPAVVTMLDIQHLYLPQFFSPRIIKIRERLYPYTLQNADAIITISDFTRQSLIDHYQIDPAKMTTIHLGVNADRFARPASDEHYHRLRVKYHLPERFLIYPAGTWQHKNHERLMQAMHHLRQQGHKDIHLMLTGTQQAHHAAVMQQIPAMHLDEQIRHLGHVEWDELPLLIQMATGMIFPSLFEGFGLPIVEAMCAGCPVAASNTTAIPEVGGDALLYFDPYDSLSIAHAIRQLWYDSDLQLSLSAAGRKRSQDFSWQTSARQTLEVYNQLAQANDE